MEVAAIVIALGFAFMLGVSDAPNASAALVGSRTATYRAAIAFSFVFHAAGAFIGGTAVAVTITGLIDVADGEVPAAYAAGGLAAIAFVTVATRMSIPTSASFGLVGGLAGAALVAGGTGAVVWGGLDGFHPKGTFGVLIGLAVSPLVGIAAAWLLRRLLDLGLRRATRRVLGPIRAGIWTGAALVALSDGTNDGQKAMGLIAGVLVATGSLGELGIPLWTRAAVAVTLALGTALGGRRLIQTVGRGIYRGGATDGLGSQASAAGVIFGSGALGFPVSTSTVVASSVIGSGIDRRPRHVRWHTVGRTVSAWAITIPACAGLGALFFLVTRAVS